MATHIDNEASATPPESRAAERRVLPRYPCVLPASLKAIQMVENSPWLGQSLDLSLGGVAVHVSRRFERDTLLALTLHGATASSSHTQLVRVVRVRPHSPDAWVLGCAFACQLMQDELDALMTAILSAQGANEALHVSKVDKKQSGSGIVLRDGALARLRATLKRAQQSQ